MSTNTVEAQRLLLQMVLQYPYYHFDSAAVLTSSIAKASNFSFVITNTI
jgi:hypothetical protein